MSVASGRSVVFFGYFSFIHQWNCPPWNNCNIVESGIKHHNPILLSYDTRKYSFGYYFFFRFIDADPDEETTELSQHDIVKAVDITSASKVNIIYNYVPWHDIVNAVDITSASKDLQVWL